MAKETASSLLYVCLRGERGEVGGGVRQGKRFTAIYDIKAARGPQDDEGAEGKGMERDSSLNVSIQHVEHWMTPTRSKRLISWI